MKGTRRASIFLAALLQAASLGAAVLKVPVDYPTIKAAVRASRSGDTVEVADGVYFEKNIILDKNIRVRSARLYGAFIYGTKSYRDSLFVVRAKVEISGFVLLNARNGILQRDSPDIAWRAHDLWILNMENAGISIDDKWTNVGSADLDNLIIVGCDKGIHTNDAGDTRVSRSILAGCKIAFAGSNHRSFTVDRSAVWNCGMNLEEDRDVVTTSETGTAIVLKDTIDLGVRQPGSGVSGGNGAIFGVLNSGRDPYLGAEADARRRAVFSCLVGETCLAKGDVDRAMAGFASAIALGRSAGFPYVVVRGLHGRAVIEARRGAPDAALGDLKAAVKEIDAIYRDIPFKLFQTEFFGDIIGVYDALLGAFLEADRRAPDRGHARTALLYADRLKAGGLLERLLAASSVRPAAGWRAGDDRSGALRREIGALQISLGRDDISVEQRRSSLERLEDVEDAYKARLIRGGGTAPSDPGEEAGLVGDPLLNFRPDPDTAVMEYFLGEKSAFLFCATRDGVTMFRLSDRSVLEDAAVGYLGFLSLGGKEAFSGRPGGRKLFDMLLGPVAANLTGGIRKLVIIPDGALAMLPFEALVRPGGGFLIEDFEVSYAPSIRCLEILSRRRRASGPDLDLFLFADPGAAGRQLFLSSVRRTVPPLAYVEREAGTVARRFAEDRSVVRRAGRPGAAAAGLTGISSARVIHFAAHAYFDQDHWWRSALLLEPGTAGFPDGLFQPFDVIGIPLVADLVVLSACQTGSGRLAKGEGQMGFASAFLAAGAKAVIASLWAIPDRSSAVFMERFYNWWARGGDAQAALRAAKIDMLRSGYSHPRHWAAFVLTGSGDARIKAP